MKGITVRVSDELHTAVTQKAETELRPVSAVVIRLLEKWVAGEVTLEAPKK